MIKNKRDLAVALTNGGTVQMANISKSLSKTITMWVSYKDIKVVENTIVGTF